jgi:hypothetical protein
MEKQKQKKINTHLLQSIDDFPILTEWFIPEFETKEDNEPWKLVKFQTPSTIVIYSHRFWKSL